ncbi:Hypothetical predicted protein [Olea europaea subsp. europaea]|uniref:Uncharacterized protein n=1 Tax=Olea europaea subsp. europaea TaxID=158383 RepID=A0A8S0S4S1_OLEEU|nr:Hypothetical predicted protein [Olea europaea subsp. europaea]
MESLFLASYTSYSEELIVNSDLQSETGLEGLRPSQESLAEAKQIANKRENSYKVKIEGHREHEMVLEWKSVPLIKVSTWISIGSVEARCWTAVCHEFEEVVVVIVHKAVVVTKWRQLHWIWVFFVESDDCGVIEIAVVIFGIGGSATDRDVDGGGIGVGGDGGHCSGKPTTVLYCFAMVCGGGGNGDRDGGCDGCGSGRR